MKGEKAMLWSLFHKALVAQSLPVRPSIWRSLSGHTTKMSALAKLRIAEPR